MCSHTRQDHRAGVQSQAGLLQLHPPTKPVNHPLLLLLCKAPASPTYADSQGTACLCQPGMLPRQPSLLNNSRQSGNGMPLSCVLPGQPSLLNNNRQSGNGMPLPGVARAAQPADQRQATRRGARARQAGKQAFHTADEVEGLVVHSLGAMSHRCTHCNALRFEHEKKRTTLCCGGGKMSGLSSAFPAPTPQPLRDLLTSVPSEHQPLPPAIKDFRQNIRAYNYALQMASTGLHICSPEQGISMIAIKGVVHHLLGPLQPAEHDVPQFAQLYIIDSMDAQVRARLAALGATGAALHQPTLAGLQQMLHDHNTFVQRFKQIMDMPTHDLPQWEVVIRVDGNVDKRRYNAPTTPEVAGLLPGEVFHQHVLLCYLFVAISHLM